jgi:two-component system nitrogen regulation response regulator NtrX
MMNSKPSLLVVDDIKDWQITIGGVLRDNGYDVATAGSMDEAIVLLDNNDYALALLDLRLDETDEGNVDGLKLAEIIRKRWPKVKIVIVTGYGTPDILHRTMEPGADGRRLAEDYLPKDNTDKLIEIVQSILGN